MSNELAVLEGKLPAYLKSIDLDDTTKALMGGGSGGESKRISIKGGVWRMLVNGKEIAQNEERAMNAVIVAASPKVSRTFYAKQYSEGGDVTSPDCWSSDGEVPDTKAKNQQSKRCIDCPQNEKGSGQGDSRACRFSQRLAVVLGNDLNGDIFQLTLPATSIFGAGEPGKWPLQTYAKMLGSKGVPVTAVVTEMKFDTNSATPRITFRPVRVLEPSEHEIAIDQGKSVAAQRAITMTVAEADGVRVTPPSALKLEVTAQEDSAEPAPETIPVKRGAKKDSESTEKKDLSKVLDEWDDDDA